MARTEFATNDPLAVKIYSAKVQKALPKASWFMKSGFVGEDPTSNCIVKMTDLQGKYGDQITYGIRNQLRGYTVPGDQNLVGKTVPLDYLDDKISLNQQRTGVNSGGRMTQQRIPYKVQEDAKDAQVDYWGVRLDEEFIAKGCGTMGVGAWETLNPSVSGFDVTGAVDSDGNTLRAPSTNRIVYAGSAGTSAAMASTDKFSLDLVDAALRKVTRLQLNQTTHRKMAPLMINGRKLWVCLMDLTHAFDLKANVAGRWYDIEKARLQGSFKDSALVQQSLGVYESAAGAVAFFSHEGMPKFNSYGAGTNVLAARSLLMGQSAMTFAPGEKMGVEGLFSNWHEETTNHGNEVVITSGLIYGIQKTSFRTVRGAANGQIEDYGMCALDAACNWAA